MRHLHFGAIDNKLNSTWLVGLLILAGFALRLAFIERNIFHADEFISLLAISSILERGEPRFPSGQLYDKGILFSYLGAGFAALVGFSPIFIRWVSLCFSILIIPLSYQFGVRVFRSPLAGLFGALVMTLYAQAMLWGGRVRMYSLIQFLYLLALFLIWLGFVQFKRLYRLIGYGLVFIGLFTHLVLILTLIPFSLALFLALTHQHQFNRRILHRSSALVEIIGVVLLVAILMPGWPRRLIQL
jgi:4-amino-4-deoxy-L-arabinose transferase-like glycosyltransferase